MASFQIAQIGHIFDGFSIGIYQYHLNKKNMPFSRNPMVIVQGDGSEVNGMIIRDMDFSFLLRNNSNFTIGLFAYNPKAIHYDEIKRHYAAKSALPENSASFFDFGHYHLNFNLQNMHMSDDHHFMIKSCNREGTNEVTFVFYCMPLDRKQHEMHYVREGISKESNEILYYISNPDIRFDLNSL